MPSIVGLWDELDGSGSKPTLMIPDWATFPTWELCVRTDEVGSGAVFSAELHLEDGAVVPMGSHSIALAVERRLDMEQLDENACEYDYWLSSYFAFQNLLEPDAMIGTQGRLVLTMAPLDPDVYFPPDVEATLEQDVHLVSGHRDRFCGPAL